MRTEPLPDVAKKIYDQINVDPNTAYEVAVGREIFEYTLNGQVVDESLMGVMQASGITRINDPNGVLN